MKPEILDPKKNQWQAQPIICHRVTAGGPIKDMDLGQITQIALHLSATGAPDKIGCFVLPLQEAERLRDMLDTVLSAARQMNAVSKN